MKGVRGFTLIELMMVVAILGVSASMAITEYTKMTAKARRTEAIGALAHVNDLQTAFKVAHDRYADSFLELGFDLKGSQSRTAKELVGKRYVFQISGDGSLWCVTATGNIDRDDYIDIVVIGNGCGG